MALYKILSSYEVDDTLTIRGFAYTAVPSTNNEVGEPWQDVVAEKRSLQSQRKPNPTPPEGITKQQLDSGQFYEWAWSLNLDQSLTTAQKLAAIEDRINTREAEIVSEIAERYRYWGFTGDSAE